MPETTLDPETGHYIFVYTKIPRLLRCPLLLRLLHWTEPIVFSSTMRRNPLPPPSPQTSPHLILAQAMLRCRIDREWGIWVGSLLDLCAQRVRPSSLTPAMTPATTSAAIPSSSHPVSPRRGAHAPTPGPSTPHARWLWSSHAHPRPSSPACALGRSSRASASGRAHSHAHWGRAHSPTCWPGVKLAYLRAWSRSPGRVLLSLASPVRRDAPLLSIPTAAAGQWRLGTNRRKER
jgi:hypothetical protein